MKQSPPFLALLLLVGVASSAGAQVQMDQAAETAAADAMRAKPLTDDEFRLHLEPEFAPKVDGFIGELASPDYTSREAAAKGLLEIGAPVFGKLRDAYHHTDDLETRLRIEEIARSAYLNYHVLDNHGFLGISMGAFDPAIAEENRRRIAQQQAQQGRPLQQQQPDVPTLPPGRVGVLVTQIIPDTGAARAGLERNDVLIGINGQPITGSGIEIRNNFSSIIRELRPGATVMLEVVRSAEVLNIQAVLGRPPEDVARASNIIVVSALYDVAQERFQKWWDQFFMQRPESAAAPTQPAVP
jgi:hypothetical protein